MIERRAAEIRALAISVLTASQPTSDVALVAADLLSLLTDAVRLREAVVDVWQSWACPAEWDELISATAYLEGDDD